jgi:hypothetical protein
MNWVRSNFAFEMVAVVFCSGVTKPCPISSARSVMHIESHYLLYFVVLCFLFELKGQPGARVAGSDKFLAVNSNKN